MIYITADFHYGHVNIAGPTISSWARGYRGYSYLRDMNLDIELAVSKLLPKDELFFIGDWSFGDIANVKKLRDKIACPVYLIFGNHDKRIKRDKKLRDLFDLSDTEWYGELYGKEFYFHHYSHRVWEKSHHGTIHCYGHSHGSIPDYGLSMDVGWDTCGYGHKKHTLYTIPEVINIMKERKTEFPDHHHE